MRSSKKPLHRGDTITALVLAFYPMDGSMITLSIIPFLVNFTAGQFGQWGMMGASFNDLMMEWGMSDEEKNLWFGRFNSIGWGVIFLGPKFGGWIYGEHSHVQYHPWALLGMLWLKLTLRPLSARPVQTTTAASTSSCWRPAATWAICA